MKNQYLPGLVLFLNALLQQETYELTHKDNDSFNLVIYLPLIFNQSLFKQKTYRKNLLDRESL